MNQHVITVCYMLVMVGTAFSQPPSQITKEERTSAIKYLKQTQNHLHQSVQHLSQDQIRFSSGEGRWSILECLEHIAESEKTIFEIITSSLDEPPNGELTTTLNDEEIIQLITDRSVKGQAQGDLIPNERYSKMAEVLRVFDERRRSAISFVKNSDDHLHRYTIQFPFGVIDAYQVLLFMAGHTERHTAQIQEIMEHPDFP